ncbi:hypothetical protein [Kribbella deserti]|uniref:Uncharacterized protein n=1 Tax=Kribbella deserti TaxID=1926257 RepID=A0ABV6QR38_9ACTN
MERKQLERAGATYTYLRGLLAIPGGLMIVVAALGNWEVPPLDITAVFLVVFLAAALSALPIQRYYNENYGRLTQTAKHGWLTVLQIVLTVALVVGASLLLRSRMSWSLDLPVNPIAIGVALAALLSYVIGVGLKRHHVMIWGALLVIGAVPLWNGADPSNIGLLLAGFAVILNGVLDHRAFVRTFGPAGALEPKDSDAGA